ncbi:MAG: leucine-rich repeat domain-containing protein [Clostridia bacterium]|nr:leucine-rich repeat domain-containing protein [Clostridia bacterium]
MKRLLALFLACVLLVSCASSALALEIDFGSMTDAELDELIRGATEERATRQTFHIPVSVKASPDKYTWYIQDYVGRNVASFGYTSIGGDRLERYGAGYLKFCFVTEDGTYLDIEDEDALQSFVVTGQNIAPNTQMKYVFTKDSKGNEYSNLLDFQSIEVIDLTVRRLDGTASPGPVAFTLIPINPSPDRYTAYIRNYVGKNLASFGYTSLGGQRRDRYGEGTIRLNLVTSDGSYIDPEDEDLLKQYIVVSQDVAPNAVMKYTYEKDSKGNEYTSLIDTQTYQGITLYVAKLGTAIPRSAAPTQEVRETPATVESVAVATPLPSQEPDTLVYRDVRYRVMEDGSVEICGMARSQSAVRIPSDIDEHPVTRIADGAFQNCTQLSTVLCWADLEYIGAHAFHGCTSLKGISIPSQTTWIGESAFEGCTGLQTVLMWGSPVSIEKNTFKGCSQLTDISIPSSVRYIGESAFEDCPRLTAALIWGNITRIETNAFRSCRKLESISVPSSCEIIEDYAFQGCEGLRDLLLWGDTSIGACAFQDCKALTEVSISSGTEYIGDHAFDGCSSLKNVLMWGSSTKIGEGAFDNCPKLKSVPR